MTTEQIIVEKVRNLPEYIHIQVIDYIDFLISRYVSEESEQEKDDALSEAHKQILIQRLELYKNNPEAGDSWENVKQRLLSKYAL